MALALVYNVYHDNRRYVRIAEANGGHAPPEARLLACVVGGFALPASVAAGVPFRFGMVLVSISVINYLVDSYTVFAASVMAGNSVLRSLFGAAFPLFTTQMYQKLGIHWASSLAAFLSVLCLPFPFLFYKYGEAIHAKCKYST
ncbi:major facilitator superfamily [Diplodia corticola]|uniref:Major facilitator superfamily n=1 Tax=Diplodia corticola TaxID=236234 RepID=A0A1J9RPP7_9PEZI|nr:major facilitator superfamily [Diplodia corticola]OJD29541.1 major facilitator superfamily [Diplodia corticola]